MEDDGNGVVENDDDDEEEEGNEFRETGAEADPRADDDVFPSLRSFDFLLKPKKPPFFFSSLGTSL